jgi:hypothetical protein
MAGRICQICADPAMMKRAAELIAQRRPDIAVAEQLGLSGHPDFFFLFLPLAPELTDFPQTARARVLAVIRLSLKA